MRRLPEGDAIRELVTRRLALPCDPDGVELTCHEIEGDGHPFVLLHGLTGHRDDFRTVLPELARGNVVRWLVPDLRGHGNFSHTGRESSFTFDQLVADLSALLDALGIDQCDVLGHSFGGMATLRFALTHPARVTSLVLMNTAGRAPERYDAALFENAGAVARERGMAFLQTLVEKASRQDPDPGPADLQTRKWADHYWPHQARRYRAMDPVAYGALGLAMVRQRPLGGELARIGCPTTVLVGEDDPGFLPAAEELAGAIPGAHQVTIPDAGHHPQMENPGAWLEALRAHLSNSRTRVG